MILNRYIAAELLKPVAAICTLLAFIYCAFSASRYLDDALSGQLSLDTIFTLVGLRLLIALDMLLPIALYLSSVLTMGRLRSDFEITAMQAAGVGEGRLLRTVFAVCLLVALVVGAISIFARPWAYTQDYTIKEIARASLNLNRLQPGTFFEGPQGDAVIYAANRDAKTGHLQNVFARYQTGDGDRRHIQVIHADSLYQKPGSPTRPGDLIFNDGRVYDLDRRGSGDRVLHFHRMVVHLGVPEISIDNRKAMPTTQLLGAHKGKQTAELEWRFLAPLAALLLGLLGVPLSRAGPRRGGRYARLVVAVLVYAGYFYLANIARTWVAHGAVGAWLPGIWWAPAVLLVLLIALTAHPLARLRRHRAAARP